MIDPGKGFRLLKGHEPVRAGDELGEATDGGLWAGVCVVRQAEHRTVDECVAGSNLQYRRAIRTDGCPDGYRRADKGEIIAESWLWGRRPVPPGFVGDSIIGTESLFMASIEEADPWVELVEGDIRPREYEFRNDAAEPWTRSSDGFVGVCVSLTHLKYRARQSAIDAWDREHPHRPVKRRQPPGPQDKKKVAIAKSSQKKKSRCGCGQHDVDPTSDVYAQHRDWAHRWTAMEAKASAPDEFSSMGRTVGIGVSAPQPEAPRVEVQHEEFV